MARHTFGTTVTLLQGVPNTSIKVMMGHEKLESTMIYARNRNGNWQYDNGEPLARNVLVRINEDIFISDAGGRISYKDIPNGNYTLSILKGGGFFASPDPVIVRNHYIVELDASSLPAEYECPVAVQDINLSETGMAQVTFHVLVRQRVIEVKKIVSPSIHSGKPPGL